MKMVALQGNVLSECDRSSNLLKNQMFSMLPKNGGGQIHPVLYKQNIPDHIASARHFFLQVQRIKKGAICPTKDEMVDTGLRRCSI